MNILRKAVFALCAAAISTAALLTPATANAATRAATAGGSVQPAVQGSNYHIKEAEQLKCLDVKQEDGRFTAGARLQRFTCHDVDEQVWTPIPVSRGGEFFTYMLQVHSSGFCLDVQNESPTFGAQVVQWPCDPSRPGQFWKHKGQLLPDRPSAATLLVPELAPSMCLDTFAQLVKIFTCSTNLNSAQLWAFV